MTTTRLLRLHAGPSPGGNLSERRPTRRRPVILLAAAVVALGQAGCKSGPLGGCGPCGGGHLKNLSERMFRPFRGLGTGGCCGSDLGGEAPPLQYGTPAVVAPAVPVVPGGTVLPGPAEAAP